MDTRVLESADEVARFAAEFIAERASKAVQARGEFTLAVSGGTTPWRMLAHLVESTLPWQQIRIFQVDERVAPAGDKSRNLTHLTAILEPRRTELAGRVHAIPVENANLEAGAELYASILRQYLGNPAHLDLVHLGLGSDGHTASLVPGDPACLVEDSDVAVTQPYQGQRRITLAFPILNLARQVLWVVTGRDKRRALQQLIRGDTSIPAGRVNQQYATLFADFDALESATPPL